jgi:hypothetical protein
MTTLEIHRFLLHKRPLRLNNFGKRAHFLFDYENGALVIIPSDGKGAPIIVSEEIFETVLIRYNNLHAGLRTIATQFGNKWPECPNFVLCPYVARIIHHYQTGL